MATLSLTILEHLKLYNKAIIRLPQSDSYELTRSKWNVLNQNLEYAVSTFGFKTSVQIVIARGGGYLPTEIKNVIS